MLLARRPVVCGRTVARLWPYYGLMDPYATLGVARDAPTEEIRRAYMTLARRTHPDVRGGDPDAAEQMRLVNRAWEMLSDSDSRAAIDRRLNRPQPPESRRATRAGEPTVSTGADSSLGHDDFGHDDFGDDSHFGHGGSEHDFDERPITEGDLPGWMRLGAPAAFVIGIFTVIFAVMAGGLVLLRFGLLLLGLSVLLFVLSPFVVLIRSRDRPLC